MRATIFLVIFTAILQAQALKPRPHVPLKGSEAAVKYGEAGVAFRAKDWDKAAEGYLAALEKDPQFAGAALLAGDARYEQHRDQEAATLFAKASQLDPLLEKAHEHRALALTRLRRLDEAVDEVFAALDINPCYAQAWEDLAHLRKAKGLAPPDHLELWDGVTLSQDFNQDLAANELRAKSASSKASLTRLRTLAQLGLLKEATFILAPKAHHWSAWETFRKAHPGALRRFVEQQQLRPSEAALLR